MKSLYRLLLLAALAAPFPISLHAQSLAWQSLQTPPTTGQVQPAAEAADQAGNLYVAGGFDGTATFGATTLVSAGGVDAFVGKYSLVANAWVWAVRAGGGADDAATALALGPNGVVYVGGRIGGSASFGPLSLTNTSGTDDAFVARLTGPAATVAFSWVTPLSSDFIDGVSGLAARAGSVYAAGSFYGSSLAAGGALALANTGGSSGTSDGYLIKLTDQGSSGFPRWGQVLGGTDYDYLNTVLVRGNNVYVGGSFEGTAYVGGTATLATAGGATDDDVLLARFFDQATSATLRWAGSAGGPGYDAATKLAANRTGLYVAGVFGPSATFGSTALLGTGPATAFVTRLPRTAATAQYSWALAAAGTGTTAPTSLVLRGLNLYVGGAYTGVPLFGPAALPAAAGPAPFVAKLTDQTTSGQWRSALAATTAAGGLEALVGSPGRGLYAVGGAVAPAAFGGYAIAGAGGAAVGYVASVGDVFPMNVVALSPTRHEGAAAAAGLIQIQFDQPVNPTAGSVGGVLVYASERGGLRNGAASASGPAVSFAPATGFRPGERVQVSITADVQSTSGAAASPQVYEFRMAAGGSGEGRLRAAGSPTAINSAPSTVVLADVNNDNLLDAISNGGTNTGVSVRLGDGRGHFGAGNRTVFGNASGDLVAGDVDGDGDIDLVFVNTASNGNGLVSIRLNDGAGNFSAVPEVGTNNRPTALALGDVNGDGDLDLVVSAQTDAAGLANGTVRVLLGDGSGTFQTSLADVPTNTTAARLVLADVNEDGRLDLLLANTGSPATLSLRLGDGLGGFAVPATGAEIAVSVAPSRLAVGDLNEDGHLDVLSLGAVGSTQTTVGVSLGDGTGQFAPAPDVLLPPTPADLALADLNADGHLDLVVQTGTGVALRLGDGAGQFVANAPGSLLGGTGGSTGALALGDVDNDGDLDAVTAGTPAGPGGGATLLTVQTLLNTPLVAPDLIVNAPGTTVGADFYNNVVVTSTGVGTLAGDVSVDGSLLIQSGGVLDDGCHRITGAGSFALAAGGRLRICDAAGIVPSGAVGAVQVLGRRVFSAFADYEYTSQAGGSGPQTGAALPARVRDLTVATGAALLQLSQPVAVRRVFTLGTTAPGGGLAVGTASLTLLSDADSTALVVQTQGAVAGPATVQRAVSRGSYQGRGYRHYSAPVAGTTVADLAVSGVFAPEVSQGSAYNASATPGLVTPFPTVFDYNQSRVATSPATGFSAFDKGWRAASALTDPLAVGTGYTLNLPATTVALTGPLVSGNLDLSLARNAGPTAPDAGWNLVGNPYPAPLDWSRLAPTDRPGVDAALYVFEPSGPYSGSFRSYANGQGNPVLPLGQGFFVRVAAGQTAGALHFRNSQRLTSFDATAFRRGAADAGPSLRLRLQGPGGPPDVLVLYAQPGASAGFDGEFDAAKLPNPSGLGLAAVAADGQPLSIQGLPVLTASTVVPLVVRAPRAGRYVLRLESLQNLPAGLTAFLVDALTGSRWPLAALPATGYAFNLSAAQAAAPVAGRFWLSFGASSPLAAAAGSAPALLSAYPNPAHGRATVLLPSGSATTPAVLILTDAVGRVVRTQKVSGTVTSFDIDNLPAGIYVLRVGAATVRLAVE